MPSHLDTELEKNRPQWVTHEHIAGYKHAGTLAGIAANNFGVDMNAARTVKYYIHLVSKIQKRHAAIICMLLHRHHERQPTKNKSRVTTSEQLDTTMHELRICDGVYKFSV